MEVIKRIKKAVERTKKELPGAYRYKEAIYQKVLKHYCHKFLPDTVISSEVNLPYSTTDGFIFAYGRMDITIETKTEYIVLELKANINYARMYEENSCQLSRYLANIKSDKNIIGILICFNTFSTHIAYGQLDEDREILLTDNMKVLKLL